MLTVNADDLGRLMNCNGSRLMPPAFPLTQLDTKIRDEGNAAHWLAQQWFNDQIDPMAAIGMKPGVANGVTITGEMVDHVAEYLHSLEQCGATEVHTSFGADTWRVNARADHIAYTDGLYGKLLYVDDLKYGYRPVDPDFNWTLIAHAIGYCLFHNITPQTIVLRIFQPRAYHPDGALREWRLTYLELMNYYHQIVATMTNPSDQLQTGYNWCAKCPALATCPAATKANMNAIDATSDAFSDDMSNEGLEFQIDTLTNASKSIKARLDALEGLAEHRLKGGAIMKDYAMEPRYGHRTWKDFVTPDMMQALTGKNLSKPGLVTPAEAERRDVPKAVVDAMTDRPFIGSKLVRASADKRARKAGLGK